MDNKEDAKLLKDNWESYAEAVVKSICEYIGVNYESLDQNNVYIVKSGDTLYAIANKYGLTVDELKELNNLSSNMLKIGQKLIISKEKLTDDNVYTVKSGDTLWSISKKNGISVDELKNINNLKTNSLSIGQKLVIPNKAKKTYVVKSGDTLYSIAKNNNTNVNDLKELNSLSNNNLSIGQVLYLP